ncbi:hypothetical protein AB0K23_04970 [Streptomyces sp. NPDC049602]|uniref:hypothetical protein n=1 Tax=Streptomyces sp. NPDC049602 TaxID=3155504 RepID=UPI003422D5EF
MTTNGAMSSHRAWLAGSALAAGLLLTACTSGHASHQPERPRSSAPTSSPSDVSSSAQAEEQKLGAQAKAALDATDPDSKGLVASGEERVRDGVHTQAGLDKGTAYKLAVVCAGSGEVEVSFTPPTGTASKVIPCDQSMAFVRFPGSSDLLVNVTGRAGSTGMIAWRVSKV